MLIKTFLAILVATILFTSVSLGGGFSLSFSIGSHSHCPPPVIRYQSYYAPNYSPYNHDSYVRQYPYSDRTAYVRRVWVPARYETVMEPRITATAYGTVTQYVAVQRYIPGYWVIIQN